LASPDDIRIGVNFKAGLEAPKPGISAIRQPTNGALTRIVGGTQILKSERSDRRHLRDVLAGFRQVEMRSVAGITTTHPGGKSYTLPPSNWPM